MTTKLIKEVFTWYESDALKLANEDFPDNKRYRKCITHDNDTWYISVYDIKEKCYLAKYFHASYKNVTNN